MPDNKNKGRKSAETKTLNGAGDSTKDAPPSDNSKQSEGADPVSESHKGRGKRANRRWHQKKWNRGGEKRTTAMTATAAKDQASEVKPSEVKPAEDKPLEVKPPEGPPLFPELERLVENPEDEALRKKAVARLTGSCARLAGFHSHDMESQLGLAERTLFVSDEAPETMEDVRDGLAKVFSVCPHLLTRLFEFMSGQHQDDVELRACVCARAMMMLHWSDDLLQPADDFIIAQVARGDNTERHVVQALTLMMYDGARQFKTVFQLERAPHLATSKIMIALFRMGQLMNPRHVLNLEVRSHYALFVRLVYSYLSIEDRRIVRVEMDKHGRTMALVAPDSRDYIFHYAEKRDFQPEAIAGLIEAGCFLSTIHETVLHFLSSCESKPEHTPKRDDWIECMVQAILLLPSSPPFRAKFPADLCQELANSTRNSSTFAKLRLALDKSGVVI